MKLETLDIHSYSLCSLDNINTNSIKRQFMKHRYERLVIYIRKSYHFIFKLTTMSNELIL